MSVVPRIQGKTLFGEARWEVLTQRSNAQGAWLVLHAWLVIAAAIAVAVVWTHPVTILLAILVIGSRQLGLAILMHDAAHGLLLSNTRWNDLLGQYCCAAPVGIDLHEYRRYHLKHHRFAQQPEDPDLVLSAPFPISRASLTRKMARDLTGLTFAKLRILSLLAVIVGRRTMFRSDWCLIVSHAVFAMLAALAGAFWVYLVLWLLPMATWNMLVTRLRNIAEHACMTNEADPWRVARTTHASWLARVFVAPYYVNYHGEHHLFMSVPCYRLPGIHQALEDIDLTRQHDMPQASGYWQVLRQVTGATA
ncbi:MAG: fatty acid desaturase family protein [Pseudomonadota bacterium]